MVRPLIQRDPVGATIFASVLANQIAVPFPGPAPLLVSVSAPGRVLAAALRIPGYPMTVVVDPEIAIRRRVLDEAGGRRHRRRGSHPSALSGRRGTVELLAEAWAQRSGVTADLRMPLLFHRLGTLTAPVGVAGAARVASPQDPADLDLLARWWLEFEQETGANAHAAATAPEPEVVLRGAARGQVVIIWSDREQPVAAAAHTPVRDGSARIAPVYTPRQFRRRGYGSAVTAAAVRSARRWARPRSRCSPTPTTSRPTRSTAAWVSRWSRSSPSSRFRPGRSLPARTSGGIRSAARPVQLQRGGGQQGELVGQLAVGQR